MKRSVQLKNIKRDPRLLALRKVPRFCVSRYRQAYRSGAKFPLLIIDQRDYIVSGNIRYEALLKEYGEDHIITVTVMKFKNQVERIEFFTKENLTHGNPIDGFTKKKISFKLQDLGVPDSDIAQLFHIPAQKIVDWGGHSVMVVYGNRQIRVPMKRGVDVDVIPGQTISMRQWREHQGHVGKNVYSLAKQITHYLNNEWVKKSDANIDALQDLCNAFAIWKP